MKGGSRKRKSASEDKKRKRRTSLTSTALCWKLRNKWAKRRPSRDLKIELAVETPLAQPRMEV